MLPSEALKKHQQFIRETVRKYHARSPRLFGSALTRDDAENSDLDILVEPTEKTSLLDLAKIECALSERLGVDVDVLTPDFLDPSFRDQVLRTAMPI